MNAQDDSLNKVIAAIRPVPTGAFSTLRETPGADELLLRILAMDVATPATDAPRQRPQLKRQFALAASIALLGMIVGVGSALILRPDKALADPVSFGEKDGSITAVFTDPEATATQIDAAFQQRGFDINAVLVPASPSLVGTVGSVVEDAQAQQHAIKTLYSTQCWTEGGGQHCPIGLLIPKDFAGQARIEVGRTAEPGEPYGSVTNAFFPGEMLHCSGIAGMTVGQAMPALEGLGVQVMWRSMSSLIDDVHGIAPALVGNQYVQYDSETVSPGVAFVYVGTQPPSTTTGLQPAFEQGC